MNNETKKLIVQYAYENMGRELAHDFSHAERVGALARKIATNEGSVDPYLAETAGLLHDIGLGRGDRKFHGEIGAQMALSFLDRECRACFSHRDISAITYAISWHNRKLSAPSQTDLLSILVDADTLDLLGAVGIWRGISALDCMKTPDPSCLATATATFQEYDSKLKQKRERNGHGIDEQLNFQLRSAEIITTNTAKKMAEPLLTTMKSFRYMLLHELSFGAYG